MREKFTMSKAFYLMLLLVFPIVLSAAETGKLKGVVVDKESGETLMGANVSVVDRAIGSATDIDGKYTISNIPAGNYLIRASYLGYKSKEVTVTIFAGKTIVQNFELSFEAIEGEVVTVTAQREGQLAAINQQLRSDEIKNVVSADKIEELPEANAAEAVGRLPGVSLLREGGEGSKVVIRGLAPQYNKVQVDGIDLSSTDAGDRSTDLSMISPFMLSGIEVTKSAMADQEANQLGGTVNFRLKGASYSGPTYQVILEGGYNGLRSKYNDYKIVAQHTRRLFDNKLGISVNVDFEEKNRSSNSVNAGYNYDKEVDLTNISSLSVNDVNRELDRLGGSIILDYITDNTDIRFSNMISRVERNTITRNENSVGLDAKSTQTRNQSLTYSKSNTTVAMSKFNIEQYFGDVLIDAGVSFSFSDNETPEGFTYGGTQSTPLTGALAPGTKPNQVNNYMNNDLSLVVLDELVFFDSYTKETELSTHLDLKWELNLAKDVGLSIKTGAKYEHKTKYYDYNTMFFPIQFTRPLANDSLYSKYPDMLDFMVNQKFPYLPFVDHDYDPGDFMAGEFTLERIPNYELGREMMYFLRDAIGVNYSGESTPRKFVPDFHASKMNDYHGYEDYVGVYFMTTFSFGKDLKIIPGVRYEKNLTNYTAIRGDGDKYVRSLDYNYSEASVERENEFFLPMIHARYKVFDGFDIRASYTNTLSRPSYYDFLPSWHISRKSINFQNSNLKPSKSSNIDVYFSFYGNKIGLLTIGGFSKRIDDLIFYNEKSIFSEEMAVDELGLTEELTGFPPSKFKGGKIGYFINNPNKVDVYGFEVEWQSNTWFLPGLLKNIVFGINYTYTHSEAIYPEYRAIFETQSTPFGSRDVLIGNEDVSFSAPLLLQPDHILNITLGYDYKDFSIRTSMQYKSDIFSNNDFYVQERAFTDELYIFDLSASQKLPVTGLSIFFNIKNITKELEGSTNVGSGYLSNRDYYGMNAAFGIKYQL